MTCFVDTSALLAVMDKDDAVHEEGVCVDKHFEEQGFTTELGYAGNQTESTR